MDNLEVGKWYRVENEVFKIKKIVDINSINSTQITMLVIKMDTVNFGEEIDIFDSLDVENWKPLETLTPKEALILLGNGFELKTKIGNIVRVTEAGEMQFTWPNCETWQEEAISDFAGLKIHALPKEAGSENG